jgi:hypothetical protein
MVSVKDPNIAVPPKVCGKRGVIKAYKFLIITLKVSNLIHILASAA